MAPYWAVLMLKLGDVPARKLVVARVFTAISRCLAVQGSKQVVVPLPRKAVAAGSKLPAGIDPKPAYDRFVIDAFKCSGVLTVDLLPRWSAPGAESMYLRHDSH